MDEFEGILKRADLDEAVVDGYCLSLDRTGVPLFEECIARRLDTNGHFMLMREQDDDECCTTVAIMTLGETFFRHRLPALLRLRTMFTDAITNRQMEIAYLEIQREVVVGNIQMEKERA